jgi:signal transduction histidine kinase
VDATGYAFLGLTVIVAMLVAVMMFALLRFAAAARHNRRSPGDGRAESLLLSTALEDAIQKLKAQERATAARAEASERLSSEIVASMASGLVVVDSHGAVQTVNPAARRILERGGHAVGADADVLSAAPGLDQVIAESLRTGAPILRQTVALDRADGPMYLGVTVSPLTAARGRAGAICLFSDLTSVVALEEQLRLKEALARLGELTAGLAHEFRNGLATIHGYARLLDPASLPEAQRPYVEGIREETQAMGAVVTNFLKFAGPNPITLAPVDLRSVIVRATEDAPSAAIDIDGEFGAVDADDVLLRQAMSNLFRNSVEACEEAGRSPVIRVHGAIDRGRGVVSLTVADNGPGIAADALGRIFQPFFTTRRTGTGLGLAIVQKIVVGHNGHIAASNSRDGGALFTITLPIR